MALRDSPMRPNICNIMSGIRQAKKKKKRLAKGFAWVYWEKKKPTKFPVSSRLNSSCKQDKHNITALWRVKKFGHTMRTEKS